MYPTILAALDGSEFSDRALAQALGLARTFGSRLILVHVYPQTSDLLGYSDFAHLVARRKQAAQEFMDRIRSAIQHPRPSIQEDLLEGPEADAILNAADAHQADLIVMGCRGLGSVRGLLLGSVSRKVVHLARCPVLLVR